MAKKKLDLKSMSKRTRRASTGLAQQDEKMHQERESGAVSSVDEVRLDQIKDRPFENTRALNPLHVVELALSINAVGLIEPIVVDQEHYLLAGGHRLFALKVLNLESREEILNNLRQMIHPPQKAQLDDLIQSLPVEITTNFNQIPVRVFQFLAREDIEQALNIESTENNQRRDYTSKEVFNLYKRLLEYGYEDVKGRPHKGQRPVKPALSLIMGQSIRSIQRKLKKEQERLNQKKKYLSQVDIISNLASELNGKIESARPKTIEGLQKNEEFMEVMRKLHEWFEGS